MMTVGTLLIILVIGGFFFLMMRGIDGGGCCGGHNHGSHKSNPSGEHQGHHHEEEDAGHVPKDPVCGMAVTVGDNTPESRYRGQAFYFCSEHCKETFEGDPERFLPSN